MFKRMNITPKPSPELVTAIDENLGDKVDEIIAMPDRLDRSIARDEMTKSLIELLRIPFPMNLKI